MKLSLKISAFALGIICFALIRFFQTELFYDPLISFYKSNFSQKPFPELVEWKYYLNLSFRYFLNSSISLILIWISFQNKSYIKFSGILYSLLFIVGITMFIFILNDIKNENYMTLFYVRRFLIQPLLVVILLPAFYFQNIKNNTDI
jgi:exosortase F-associated protein